MDKDQAKQALIEVFPDATVGDGVFVIGQGAVYSGGDFLIFREGSGLILKGLRAIVAYMEASQ